jgi:hypothetical protein
MGSTFVVGPVTMERVKKRFEKKKDELHTAVSAPAGWAL